eukprot:CAMPEP_0205804582 /NCGR_PEP_ID=MMETSP0205-20121125/7549_1 /ASSEMBLY_ACC=CAM_ASM_000278 /TAXON_ID=36767 /ORGANISM="Euplotes focardii, Strain TN1" /LENGTH=247 /DNA_ID=CAMNT_0053074431 /DNA_START=463 /DNA_END=1206 /DNA_ORIENTATION=+
MINHLPPEFFTFGHDRDEYSDIWALGIILFQLSTAGEFPFMEETEDGEFDEFETKRNIINVEYEQLEEHEKSQLLLEQIFTAKPHNRLTVEGILKFLEDKIDMKKLKTAMKKASENIEVDSEDESSDDIKKKLDFLMDPDASEDDIMKRQSVMSGIDHKKTNKNFGDEESLNPSDSGTEKDYQHLENLVGNHGSKTNKNSKNYMDNLPDSIDSSSNADNSEESKDEESSIESAGQYAAKVHKKKVVE